VSGRVSGQGGIDLANNLDELCDTLNRNIETLTVRWVKRVRQDPYLKSDDHLTLTQIIDHIPQMLEELCEIFGAEEEPDFDEIRASSQHGYIRAAEGYSLTELLRELEILRDCIFDFVADTEIELKMERKESLQALRRVNKYFSEDIIFVVEHYLSRRSEDAEKSRK
jgi:hypothetical protein